METKPMITVTSVKVMRSYDYCHFEISLGMSGDSESIPLDAVDRLRKDAARLADKAVEQYKVAKEHASLVEQDVIGFNNLKYAAERAELTPEEQRTPQQKEAVKALNNYNFQRERYDYEDDWKE
jgi:hypothetical protein